MGKGSVLNLGAGGFIGSHLTGRLLDEGYQVVAVDTHSDKIRELLDHENLTYLNLDIRHVDWPLDALVRDADLVIDLIAHANPGIYMRRPLDVFRLNFTENLRVADSCVRWKKRLIQFSSCEVYGKTAVAMLGDRLTDPENPRYATFSEDSSDLVLGPVGRHRWIYAAAKQLLERVLHAYGLEGRLDYTIIRPFNFIGPKIDYLPSEEGGFPRVFSFFMEALLTGKPLKLVEGGRQRRCYTYIDDAVECTHRILVNSGGVCDRQIFNIGSAENETTIRGLAEMMREFYRREYLKPGQTLSEIVSVPAEEFYGKGYDDSDRRIPDTSKARKLLDWKATWGLRDIVQTTMDYYARRSPVAYAAS